MIKILAISLALFLVCTDIRVTPLPLQQNLTVSPWKFIEESQLKSPQFQYLTNKTVLPFLSDCYSVNCCIKWEQTFCPSYFEMALHLSYTNLLPNLIENDVQNLQATKETMNPEVADQFCKNFSKIIPKPEYNWNGTDIRKNIQNQAYCLSACTETNRAESGTDIWFTLKPFCKMISWMASVVTNTTLINGISKSPENKVDPGITRVNNNIQNEKTVATAPKEDETKLVAVSDGNQVNNVNLMEKNNVNNDTVQVVLPEKVNNADTLGQVETQKVSNEAKEKQTLLEGKNDDKPSETLLENVQQNIPETFTDTKTPKGDVGLQTNNNQASAIDKNPAAAGQPPVGKESIPPNSNQPKENAEELEKIPNSEGSLGKLSNQETDGNQFEINQDDPDDVFQQDNQKSDQLQIYSNEDDVDADDIPPHLTDTKKLPKEPTIEEIIETNSHEIMQKAGVGVSANYIPESDPFYEEAGSNFFTYFLAGMFICILLYVLYHNKAKILALIVEGRRSQKSRGGRRKHTAQYRKLDTNLEEAITSSASGRSTQIIY